MNGSDATLRRLTGYVMRRATIPVLSAVNDILAEFGLRRTTFSALTIIRDNPGLQQGQLADLLAMERPNLVQIVDDLQKAGLVQRRRNEEDRRAYSLYATQDGVEICVRAFSAMNDFEAVITNGLSGEETEFLHRILRRIQTNAEQGGKRCDRKISSK